MSAAERAGVSGDHPSSVLWRPGPRPDFGCHHDHRHLGSFDESARRLMHEELAVASLLVAEGHQVVALREESRRGRTPDLAVCDRTAEVKTVCPPEPELGGFPSAKTIRNKLVKAMGQSDTVIIHAAGSGLSASAVRQGVQLFAQRGEQGGIRAVRILGDGYDLSFRAHPSRIRVADQPAADQLPRRRSAAKPSSRGLGL